MAKDSLFGSRVQPAKASVVLKLKKNRPLAPGTTQGITNLVAASVEGLRPESVVLLDSFGRPLARPTEDGDDQNAMSGMQTERQQRLEKELSTRVVSLLEPVVGVDRVRVNVAARLNMNTEEQTEERFDPATVIRSRQVTMDGSSNGGSQGLAGARGNLPGAGAAHAERHAGHRHGAAGGDRLDDERAAQRRDRQLRSEQDRDAHGEAARRHRAPLRGRHPRRRAHVGDRRAGQGDAQVGAAQSGRTAEDPADRRGRGRLRPVARRPAHGREHRVRRDTSSKSSSPDSSSATARI